MNCFSPVEHVVVAVAHRAGARAPRRPSPSPARSGSSWRSLSIRVSAGSQRRRCVVAAEGVDHPGAHVVDREEGRHRRAALAQRLEDQGGVERGSGPSRRHPRGRRSRPCRAPPPRAGSRPGSACRASQSRACGAMCSAAKPRAMSRMATWSSSSPKLMGILRSSRRCSLRARRRRGPSPSGEGRGEGSGVPAGRAVALSACRCASQVIPRCESRLGSDPRRQDGCRPYRIVGMENSAPLLMPRRPALRHGLGLGVEADRVRPVLVQVAEARALPAAEGVVGDRHRDRHVDADHADVDPGGEVARGVAVLGEDRDAVAVLVGRGQRQRLLVVLGPHHREHRARRSLPCRSSCRASRGRTGSRPCRSRSRSPAA